MDESGYMDPHQTDWVKAEDFYMDNPWGFTAGQCKGKIQRRVWRRGIEFAVIDGRSWFNLKGIEQWFGQQAQDQRVTVLSRLGGDQTRGAMKSSNSLTPMLASVKRLV